MADLEMVKELIKGAYDMHSLRELLPEPCAAFNVSEQEGYNSAG